MKKKIISFVILATSIFSMTGCLDVAPDSSLTDANMWTSAGHFDSFVSGVHSRLRDHSFNLFLLGEVRADVYSAETAFTGESNTVKNFALNLIKEEEAGIGNYGDFYANINQINLFISKATNTSLLSESNKKQYLGEMYGLRAFYYFHLLRSWGNVVYAEEPSVGFEVGKLERAVTPATEVMTKIKESIETSLNSFGDDYSFRQTKGYWSKAATLMLKAEVYLWSSRQMNGGSVDAEIAKASLTDIQNHVPSLKLEDLKTIFSYSKKGNDEIIFAIRYKYEDAKKEMFDGKWRDNMLPQTSNLISYYDKETGNPFDVTIENYTGRIQYPVKDVHFTSFDDKDGRKKLNFKDAYKKENGILVYKGCFAYKYQGMTPTGAATRFLGDDYPIYRYADLLLMLAEAKSLTGGDPKAEINEVRKRAYGVNYVESEVGYPNLLDDRKGVDEAILNERFKEFMFEGKRWYDLRRFGSAFVTKYTTAEATKLLWPVDKSTITKNPAIRQTDGYTTVFN